MNAFEITKCQSCNKTFSNDEKRRDDIKHVGSLSGKVLCGACFNKWNAEFAIESEFYEM